MGIKQRAIINFLMKIFIPYPKNVNFRFYLDLSPQSVYRHKTGTSGQKKFSLIFLK